MQPKIAVVGGGLAGLATAVALGSADYPVTVFEARPFLGGRATSYPLNTGDENSPTIDNCQHVLLRCCANLIDFYRRLGVRDRIRFYREFYWIEPGGRVSTMRRGILPAPFHFTGSFARLKFLSMADKYSVATGLLAVRYEYGKRADLDRITMLDWLREKRQTPRAIERFWRQVLVSAVSEDLDRMAAIHGLQVFALGFLDRADAYEMGVPNVPLRELYSERAWANYPQVKIAERAAVERVQIEGNRVSAFMVNGEPVTADAYVLALPFERLAAIAPDLPVDVSSFTHVPITGIHLWFDRAITKMPHAT
ncbi:MAG: hydroxysqualene dehydroxylase HpnE, partial [Bryobacteraceae bacterium]